MGKLDHTKGKSRGLRVYFAISIVVCLGFAAVIFLTDSSTLPIKPWIKPAHIRSYSVRPKEVQDNPTSGDSHPKSLIPKDAGPIKISVSLVSPTRDAIKVGDMLHFLITCTHEDGTLLGLGGGLWYATLSSKSNPKASTAGKIVDHNNGTYSVFVFAAWAGQGTIVVRRVLSSEAVNFMLNTVWPAEDRVVWRGLFKVPGAKGKLSSGLCRLSRRGNWTGKCVYPNKKALGKTVFLCDKPRGVNCSTLYATKSDSRRISARMRELSRGKEDLFQRAKLKPMIQLLDPTVKISGAGAGAVADPPLPRCLPDMQLPVSQGFWLEDKWHSLLCDIKDWTEKSNLTSCLRGKTVLLFGDSTTRQWFVHILDLMDRKFVGRLDDFPFFWHRYYKDIDLSITISFPKELVGSATVELGKVFYEHDLIDKLNDTRCNYVIMVSPWAHFSQWTRESYTERTQLLREALIRLRRRCPETKIVLKGPHPRDQKDFDAKIYCSDVILKGIGEINQRLLGGIGVWFLPIWDINLAFPGRKTIHMPVTVIHEEVKLFFSYVCGDSKMPPLKAP
ncbi:NXPE family member 4-like [Acanthaster planci]|uniref:NXPE family member 4-like n=1 Tax=Acanthaster planci TaxID=133434 RepID=A0A8B7YKG0_ACAPL|nr:NXPE family member 4-like [Acanthaster planci]